MHMNHLGKPASNQVVNWDSPDLKKLLDKTASWGLDNRGVYAPTACEMHVGWGAGAGRFATLVYEREGVMVVETDFDLPQGEHVRVDRIQAGALRSSWGIVVDGRAGQRDADRAGGIRVHWIHLR